jgi:CheY-like chemotaxis protein
MSIDVNRTILMVEDSPEDYETTIRAFKESGLANPIMHCEDGDEALDFLYSRNEDSEFAKTMLPGLILLDLNLPGTDGREVLQKIKTDDRLKKIPVIVLTTSNDERDIERCYEYGANSYVPKPVDLDGFIKSIQRLKDYWFEIVLLPKEAV